MTSLSAENRARLILATKGAAAAFLEDMKYLREVTGRIETSRGELRRLSAVLRRLLPDGDITKIAAPRIGRTHILAPDNRRHYKMAERARVWFFASGWANIFGVYITAISLMELGPAERDPEAQIKRELGDPDKISPDPILLRAGNFIQQRVLCYKGHWIGRGTAITHVANFASGVHSGTPVKDEDVIVAAVRKACSYRFVDGQLTVHMMRELGSNSFSMGFGHRPEGPNLDFSPDTLDPLLVEVLAAAQLLVESLDIARLEDYVIGEFSGRS